LHEVDDYDWFAGLVEALRRRGLQLFRDIAAVNGFSCARPRFGQSMVAGEVPLALTVFNHTAAAAPGRR
jgi:hypothetical protein